MSRTDTVVQIFTRAPIPGESKTRLIPALGAHGAAAVHRTMLWSAVHVATSAELGPVELWCTPDDTHSEFGRLRQRYPQLQTCIQRGNSLGDRLAAAARRALLRNRFVIAVGSDCPALDADDLRVASQRLEEEADAVIGPAEDGGYYLIALRKFDVAVYGDVTWGTGEVAQETRGNFARLGWHWVELSMKTDVDSAKDLLGYPEVVAAAGVELPPTPEF